MITIVDYGMGNLGSIRNMLKRIGVEAVTSSDPEVISRANKLILPGVGAFDLAVTQIRQRGLWDVIDRRVTRDGVPILGICLGFQLLSRRSEEGEQFGFGWIDADTIRFRFDSRNGSTLKVPHMGWNLASVKRNHRLVEGLDESARFYFVHSYHLTCDDPGDVLLTATYGYEFPCGVQRGNIAGVQFHPEKSHRTGMQLLANFAAL